MHFSRKSKQTCSYISHIFWKSEIKFKSWQVFYSLKLNDLSANHACSSYYLNTKQKPELSLIGMVTPTITDFRIFHVVTHMVWQHDISFLNSIISSYELHSFFEFLNLKLKKLQQPVTKYIETTTFGKIFPLPPCCKLRRDHAVYKLLTHNIHIEFGRVLSMEKKSLSFLKENPNKLFFVE